MTPAFALGRNPKETIITISYGSDLAEGFGRRVRNLLSDPAFHEIYPACRLSPDSAAAYRFETTAGGEFSAVGRGGPITGRGASLLILDDVIKNQQEANSETVCKGIIEWLESVCFTRLTPGGRVLAIATRWSERDPIGWLMQRPGWTILHLPALAEPGDPLGRETHNNGDTVLSDRRHEAADFRAGGLDAYQADGQLMPEAMAETIFAILESICRWRRLSGVVRSDGGFMTLNPSAGFNTKPVVGAAQQRLPLSGSASLEFGLDLKGPQ